MSEKESFWSSWQERLSALRNVPPVLKIVWRVGAGRGHVRHRGAHCGRAASDWTDLCREINHRHRQQLY